MPEPSPAIEFIERYVIHNATHYLLRPQSLSLCDSYHVPYLHCECPLQEDTIGTYGLVSSLFLRNHQFLLLPPQSDLSHSHQVDTESHGRGNPNTLPPFLSCMAILRGEMVLKT
ncbi:uncharacterized protein BJ212DRAFT_866360 [Suillus subaureus]|uniref:Uncharacterized protein n=1 Tax=Suillus subaureus TaxID=48587 RepID=A0A9P7DXH8_9AGAM|nr:uncharacterized protein BJ212DRAFT_866360 [Suillus subaureus]KAG1805443.1 hypothetical protein BJ212DRAFT_866360 [Suillus subaureus]